MVYVSNESGPNEVYIRAIPGPSGRVQISQGGGIDPVWSRDGREVFYRSPTHMMVARVETTPEVRVVRRDTLFVDTYVRLAGHPSYDVSPDGRELLMVRGAGDEAKVVITLNWISELRQRMRAAAK